MIRFLSTILLIFLLGGCTSGRDLNNSFAVTAAPSLNPETLHDESAFWQASPPIIWARLQTLSPSQLTLMANHTHSESARAWIDLTEISREKGTNSTELLPALIAWREHFPNHPATQLLPDKNTLITLNDTPLPQHIALLLPLQGPSAHLGKTIRLGFLNTYYTFLKINPTLKPTLSFYDTNSGKPIHDIYQQAVNEGADQIIGPLTREEVRALSQQSALPVPVLTLNYTPPRLLFGSAPNLIQFGLAPEDEAIQMAAHARSSGFSRALLIAPQDSWGNRVSQAFISAWRTAGGQIIDSLYFESQKPLTNEIANLLKVIPDQKNDNLLPEEHRRRDIDVIFLLASGADARQIVPLLKFNYSGTLPIYSISAIYSGTPNRAADLDLEGVIFCDIPWILRNSPKGSSRLIAVGHDAWQLAIQIPRLKALPNFPVNGWTGALTLQSNQRIFRQLTWMKIKNGQPQPESW